MRTAKGLSARALATSVGLSHSTIARIEKGERKISTPQAVAIAEFFGVSVDYLLGKTADEMFAGFVDSMKKVFLNETASADGSVTQDLDSSLSEPIRTKLSILFLLDGISSPESLRMIYDLAKLRSAYDDFGGDQQ